MYEHRASTNADSSRSQGKINGHRHGPRVHDGERSSDFLRSADAGPESMTAMPSPAPPNFGPFPDPVPAPPFHLTTNLKPSPSSTLSSGVPQEGGQDSRINIEEARAAVKDMRTIVEDLAKINTDLLPDRVLPSTKDLISTNYVDNCARAVGQAGEYFKAWQNELASAVRSLDQQVKAHELAEELNRQNIARS